MEEKNYNVNTSDNSEELLRKNRKLFKRYLLVFLVVFVVIGSFYLGFECGKKQGANGAQGGNDQISLNQAILENKVPSDKSVDFSLFWKVWDLVKEKHVNKNELDAQKMVYGAINGMLRATGDPYSTFFDPKETQSFSQDIGGSFEGIGAELGVKDDILTVIAPLDDSPAQKAGLIAGDKIIKINGKISTDFTIDQAVDMIRGKKGTSVILNVLHPGAQETKDVTIVRDQIEVKSVKVDFKDNGIVYVKITKFSDNTAQEFDQAVNQIMGKNIKGIIIDVRNNPGGLLDKCVDIASRMIPKGKVVVTEEDSAGNKESLKTTGGDRLSSIPTVMLINEGSASASEILAGALKDDQGVTLIGKKSFGKGSVQELMSLSGGSSVKITVARWLTPNGDYIMEKGISPDVEVNMSLDDFNNNRDPQLDKAMEIIKTLSTKS
jgi:carboxyl-terminal processing protease